MAGQESDILTSRLSVTRNRALRARDRCLEPAFLPPGAAGGIMLNEEHTMLNFGIVRKLNNIQFHDSGIIDVFDD